MLAVAAMYFVERPARKAILARRPAALAPSRRRKARQTSAGLPAPSAIYVLVPVVPATATAAGMATAVKAGLVLTRR